jgi:hypothetical protein
MSIEQEIKSQYAKVLRKEDSETFKHIASYYFETAAKLKKKDINIEKGLKLLARNIQKRLFIGVGAELLLKALYLDNGFCVNKSINKRYNRPVNFEEIKPEDINEKDTFTIVQLIDSLGDLDIFSKKDLSTVKKGLNIAKVFRNKEGHVAVKTHAYDSQNFSDIESSVIAVYKFGFKEELEFRISMESKEEPVFKIKN